MPDEDKIFSGSLVLDLRILFYFSLFDYVKLLKTTYWPKFAFGWFVC